MKKHGKFTTLLLLLGFFAGLSLLLYPTLSNYWNSIHATKIISDYEEAITEVSKEQIEEMWNAAVDYNRELYSRGGSYALNEEQQKKYESILNIGNSGVMGYIEIPSIDVSLPIYHGTSDGVLQVAVGHMDWTSLPVGGVNTHCVLSGHRGLPSAKLFTDIDDLREGDTFTLVVLDKTLTYEVDRIRVVEPAEVDGLLISEGKDYCTLVTCTPYGINSHRLLVRGHRIETDDTSDIRVVSEGVVVDPLIVTPIAALPLILILLLKMLLKKLLKKRRIRK